MATATITATTATGTIIGTGIAAASATGTTAMTAAGAAAGNQQESVSEMRPLLPGGVAFLCHTSPPERDPATNPTFPIAHPKKRTCAAFRNAQFLFEDRNFFGKVLS
jgi:hypothetical protein